MTGLEIVLIMFIWVIVGLFICYKRKWYVEDNDSTEQMFECLFATVLAPFNLVLTFIKYYLIQEWENKNKIS